MRILSWCVAMVLASMVATYGIEPPETGKDTAKVMWIDGQNGETLFTSDDIVRFDWEQQLFELTRTRTIELMTNPFFVHRSFVVKDQDGIIYTGHINTPISSRIFPGPIINLDFFELPPPLFSISDGHLDAGEKFAPVRAATRLHDHLAKAGVLKAIDRKDAPAPILRRNTGNISINTDLSVSVYFFPETFIPDGDAVLPVFLHKEAKDAEGYDVLIIRMWLADGQQISNEQEVLTLTPEAFASDKEEAFVSFIKHFHIEKDSKVTDDTHLVGKAFFYKMVDGKPVIVKESTVCDIALKAKKE